MDCGSYKLYLYVSVCLSRYYGLYLAYYGLDFDQTWYGENVGTLVRLIVSKCHKNRFSVDVFMTSFLFLEKRLFVSNSAEREKTL